MTSAVASVKNAGHLRLAVRKKSRALRSGAIGRLRQ
jgi:hypothetical protein